MHELRGHSGSSQPVRERVKSWDELDHDGKVESAIQLMSNTALVKKGKSDGTDTFIRMLENEPAELIQDILRTAKGREACVTFICRVYRSQRGGMSVRDGRDSEQLFQSGLTEDQRKMIRDAELDARAYGISGPGADKEDWLSELSADQRMEVLRRAERYGDKG